LWIVAGFAIQFRSMVNETVPHPDADKTDAVGQSNPSDASLLQEIHHGDEDAAQALFDRYIGRLQHLAERQLGKEVSGRVDRDDVT
jgi:hypothetical protein